MKQNRPDKLSKATRIINQHDSGFIIITHKNPDGDAIGSACGLMLSFKNMNKNCRIIVPDSLPSFLNWIPGAKDIIVLNYQERTAWKAIKEARLIFVLDFNDLSRIDKLNRHVEISDAYKIMIDHHPCPDDFADLTISNTEVSSTSELLYTFLVDMGLTEYIDNSVATALYTGIMTDTGCFSFNSSRTETFRIVSDLLGYGIDKDRIYDRVYHNFSPDRMRLMGYCLNEKMVHLPEFRTAYIWLTQKELRQFNFKKGDTEGFVNLPLSIKGVCFSALFVEREDLIKISFRSKGKFAVNLIAERYFEGGGHDNASGGESKKTMDETIKDFVSLLPQYRNELLESL